MSGLIINLLIFLAVCQCTYGEKHRRLVRTIISNGLPAEAKVFLDLAALGFGNPDDIQWDCGGVLVHPKFVLTAAHCLYSRRLDSDVKYARLGDLNLFSDTDNTEPQQVEIKKLYKYPDYVPSLYYHDIALLELEMPVNITIYVNITAPEEILGLRDDVNQTAVVAGWGRTSFSGPKSDRLLYAPVTIFDSSVCKAVTDTLRTRKLKRGFDKTTQMCAVGTEGRDTCVGDSGGPIYKLHDTGRLQLVGITSAGMGCGGSLPGLYTNLAYYVPWIKNVITAVF